ncbi:hypothetical protein OAK14_00115 [Candidatus Marinimicrobia bacterium]|nr:hypothetical protein [Candidatus Neomarinimicrobiota bacterium]MDG2265541.1 hypothetical protein [Candidatus Neomarinimicrobiota bacterium]RZP29139.1 MAG: hypothetical protein EVA23_06425 [bacterium]|tara:strand:+ start:2120 stop:2311 length:192 start_codon:yes stop_codon:yes gene_type:complete
MNANSWYMSMILSIFIAVLAFVFGTKVFGYDTQQQAREVGIFIGLWAPTFGALGIRAQLNNKS